MKEFMCKHPFITYLIVDSITVMIFNLGTLAYNYGLAKAGVESPAAVKKNGFAHDALKATTDILDTAIPSKEVTESVESDSGSV